MVNTRKSDQNLQFRVTQFRVTDRLVQVQFDENFDENFNSIFFVEPVCDFWYIGFAYSLTLGVKS